MVINRLKSIRNFLSEGYIEPDSDMICWWKGIVAFAIIYNCWSIILRIAWDEELSSILIQNIFNSVDFLTDILLMMDVLCKFRICYLKDGILVKEVSLLRENYKRKRREFLCDTLVALPIDRLLYLIAVLCKSLPIILHPFIYNFNTLSERQCMVLRFVKLLKIKSTTNFFHSLDARTNSPYIVRACKLMLILGTIIHWIACFYYIISKYEGLNTNEWVLQDVSLSQHYFLRTYLRCLYWSTMTLTTIGDTTSPKTDLELMFTGLTFLIGVFLFAAVVGSVGEAISNMHASRVHFQQRMDALKFFMAARQIPTDLQQRVKKWANYQWQTSQTLEDNELLKFLPHRLRFDISQNIHLDTVRKIRIFQECESGFLSELVMKLKSQVYSPTDYVCKAGEIGREMYIINSGKVEVSIFDSTMQTRTVVATLSEGDYFGEISVLQLDSGINRRIADVRSIGFSELLVLSKKDLTQVLNDYPTARQILEKYAQVRIQKNQQVNHTTDTSNNNNNKTNTDFNFCDTDTEDTKFDKLNEDNNNNNNDAQQNLEITHILKELRSFDSLSCRYIILQLQNKCKQLEKNLKKQEDIFKTLNASKFCKCNSTSIKRLNIN